MFYIKRHSPKQIRFDLFQRKELVAVTLFDAIQKTYQFAKSKFIWAKQVNQNWRKLLELEHQHPEQIRILVTGMSHLPRRIAYRLQQVLLIASDKISHTTFQALSNDLVFCIVIRKRVRAGCANHFANLFGEVNFMKAP